MFDWLIVDGYNIIFSWSEFEDLRCLDLGLARDKLAHILQDYCAFSGKKITLVFDAHMVRGSVTTVTQAGSFELIFTREGETADMLIEKMVGTAGSAETVFVVTADWIEQSVIFGRGAFRMTPAELQQIIEQSKIKELAKLTARQQNTERLGSRLNDNLKEIMEQWRRDDYSKKDTVPAWSAATYQNKIPLNTVVKTKAKIKRNKTVTPDSGIEATAKADQEENSEQLSSGKIKSKNTSQKKNSFPPNKHRKKKKAKKKNKQSKKK